MRGQVRQCLGRLREPWLISYRLRPKSRAVGRRGCPHWLPWRVSLSVSVRRVPRRCRPPPSVVGKRERAAKARRREGSLRARPHATAAMREASLSSIRGGARRYEGWHATRACFFPPKACQYLRFAAPRPGSSGRPSASAIGTSSDAQSRPIFYSLPRRRCYARHGVDRPASRHAGPRSLLPRPPQRGMEARPCLSQ